MNTEDPFDPPMLNLAVTTLEKGGVIAYPTEGVYGFGCDPLNQIAVNRLLRIKGYKTTRPLILIADSFSKFIDYIEEIPENCLANVLATWPGPFTWIFPSNEKTPRWIRSANHSVALRVSNHPLIKTLCRAFNAPLVSTSANSQGSAPATTYEEVYQKFNHQLDLILAGEIGDLNKPTSIREALTGKVIRE